MDIELFLNNFNQNCNINNKIKIKLLVEVNGSNYERSLEGNSETLKPLVQKLNSKIKKYEDSINKKQNFVTPGKGSTLNLLHKNSTANLSSPSLIHRTSPDVLPMNQLIQSMIPTDPTVFGVSVDNLMARERSDSKIPQIISNLLNNLFLYSLGVEGLFRISGSQIEIQNRKNLINRGDYHFSRDDNPHVLTVLLKQLLRELPEPVCTNALYDLFLASSDQINFEQSKENGFEVLKKTINSLPIHNRNLLQYIILFLTFVGANKNINLMGPSNLSRVFGPNLFWKKESGPLDIQMLQSASEKVNSITEQMILHYNSVFEEPLSLSFNTYQQPQSQSTPNLNLVPTGNYNKKLNINSKLLGHNKSIQWMALCDTDQKVWSLDSHGFARIWDAQNQCFIKEVPIAEGAAVYQMVSASDNTIWAASSNRLSIWDVDGGFIGEVPGEAFSVCESQNKEIWVGGFNVLTIYPLEGLPSKSGGEPVKPIGTDLFMKGTIILAMCKVGSNRIWGCSSEKTLYVWDSKTKEVIHTSEIQEKRPKRMTCIDIDDLETIWIGGDEGTIQIFNSKTFKLEHKIPNLGWDKIFHLTSIGNSIWASFWDTTVRVIDPKTKEISMEFKGFHSDVVSSIVEVPNHKPGGESFIWLASYDKSITIHSMVNREKNDMGPNNPNANWSFTNIKRIARPTRPGFSSRG
ncbi:hypothetical protein DICPUDRAFT_95356 [Dictyostelium purpureum]|uniref:Rho-GAP domain-containing protein n=1 Tax=Dictyostelium purpureum TaxID=5786 RepID=F0ZVF2_DICPU|nr:uncharacterized protein DICPUDRAFT_95356 [Dictyostelium purpureum]EGC32069.1 hypothetical protein DICPUDRAFT_95356 [Dictyostelium purpureum]|eukprot:XP_003291392.1 hypothetical protein DICPUDRAFT_95356 [Dictyostelium purpureum]